MIDISGYKVNQKLYKSANSQIYRATRKVDNQAVILKVLSEYPTPEERAHYRQEYRITKSLNSEGVIKAYSLERYKNTLMMILEDIEANSLALSFERKRSMDLEKFLKLAIRLVEIVGQIHRARVIHKDINPTNIILNEKTGQLKIIDFGIASQLSQEAPTLQNPEVLEGTLAYVSPEQTGRMNRTLDYRTDFYSLGVTFYQLLRRDPL